VTGSTESPDASGDPGATRPTFRVPGASDPADTAVLFEPAEAGEPQHLDGEALGAEDDLDSEFAPRPRARLGALTIGLAALLVAGAGFLAGVQVQQHSGSSSSTNPLAAAAARRAGAGTATGAAGAGGGFGGFAGGRGGGTGAGAGAGGTGAGGTATGGTGTGSTGTTSIPAVIGQIVSITGDTVVVKNLGGQMITVKLSDTTTVTQAATTTDLKAGQNVTVSGTTGADGTVTATAVGTR
jgi:hypothetical protein